MWYFIIVGVLTVSATSVLVIYNLNQQLRPEKLETARALWKEKGPRTYHLVYTIKLNDDQPTPYDVHVDDGRVTSVLVNGQPDSRHHWYGMDRLYDYIEADLERDRKSQRRNFTRAHLRPRQRRPALVRPLRPRRPSNAPRSPSNPCADTPRGESPASASPVNWSSPARPSRSASRRPIPSSPGT